MVTEWVSKQETKEQMKDTREVTSNTEIKNEYLTSREITKRISKKIKYRYTQMDGSKTNQILEKRSSVAFSFIHHFADC